MLDAEQGTSDDGWCRGVVDSTIKFHRGLLYRSNPMGLNRSDAYPLERKSEHGYCNDSNTSKEYLLLTQSVGLYRVITEDGCIAEDYSRREIAITVNQSEAYLEVLFRA